MQTFREWLREKELNEGKPERLDYHNWTGSVFNGSKAISWKSGGSYLSIIKVPYESGTFKYVFTGQDSYGESIKKIEEFDPKKLLSQLKKQFRSLPSVKDIEKI